MMTMMMTTTSRTQSGGLPTTTTTSHGPTTTSARSTTTGRFEFDDGGTYCGGSDSGRAHGFGVCTGPGMQGEYAGAWQSGFETSGVYTWPNGSEYCGQWMQGKRHGLGVERRGRWVYKGEWTQGSMGRYGVRLCTTDTVSKYEGTWTSGLQDGYGLETYSDTGTYQGQWMKGQRHGYGVRKSAVNRDAAPCRTHINALHTSSLTSIRSLIIEADQSSSPSPGLGRSNSTELRHQQSLSTADRKLRTIPTARIGFYLIGHCVDSSDVTPRRSSLIGHQSAAGSTHRGSLSGGELRRQRSASDVNSDTAAAKQRDSLPTDPSAIEMYSGEWKNDKRSGHGVCERSDGLKYEGEWLDNCKCGYGVTTFGGGPDVPGGWREEGKYKNNVLLSPGKKIFLPLRSSKVRERIDSAVASALRAAQLATQKSDIANSRMESARSKAELADQVSAKAQADADRSRLVAKDVELRERQGEFTQIIEPSREQAQYRQPLNAETMVTHTSLLHSNHHPTQKQQQQQQQHRGYNELNKPMEESMVDVGNDRVIFRDNSIVRRQCPVTSSTRPSPSQSRSSLSQVTADYSHMNHVDPGGHRSQIDHVTPATSVPQINNNMTDSTSSMSHSGDIAAGSETDRTLHWSEDTDSNKGHDLSTEGHDPAKVGVQTRPSLRYRRDFHCPNLVIFNKTPSRVDLSTACGPTGPSDAVKQTSNTSRPVHRRLTMPSIIKYTPPSTRQPPAPTFTATAMPHVSTKTETYIVENCARKRLEEEDEMVDGVEMARGAKGSNKQINGATASVVAAAKGATTAAAATTNLPVLPVLEMTSLDGLDPPKPITKRYRLQSSRLGRCSGRPDLGSLPDISVVRQLQDRTPIPRHEALILCQQKRDELQQIYEQQQQQHRRAIVLRLGDLKAWCDRRQLLLFVSAVNAALFVAFYRLLCD